MPDSESLARLFQDETRADIISRLRRETQATIEELKRNKDLLEPKLGDTLQKFGAKRDELESLERAAVDDMLREDKEYRNITCANLEQAVLSVIEEQIVPVVTANETDSETDLATDCFKEPRRHQTSEMD